MQIFYNILRHPVFTHSHLCKYNYDILANCLFYNIIAVKNFTKMTTPIEASIRQKLTTQLETTHLEVINESYMHNVPKGSETHFKVVVVTDRFKDLPMIKVRKIFKIIVFFTALILETQIS